MLYNSGTALPEITCLLHFLANTVTYLAFCCWSLSFCRLGSFIYSDMVIVPVLDNCPVLLFIPSCCSSWKHETHCFLCARGRKTEKNSTINRVLRTSNVRAVMDGKTFSLFSRKPVQLLETLFLYFDRGNLLVCGS